MRSSPPKVSMGFLLITLIRPLNEVTAPPYKVVEGPFSTSTLFYIDGVHFYRWFGPEHPSIIDTSVGKPRDSIIGGAVGIDTTVAPVFYINQGYFSISSSKSVVICSSIGFLEMEMYMPGDFPDGPVAFWLLFHSP